MIIMPKKEILIAHRSVMGMKGFFRLRTIDKFSGKVRIQTDWMPNTILNAGRNIMADRSDWFNYCQVGESGTFDADIAVRQAETSLQTWKAGTSDIQSDSNGQQSSAPYYGWRRKTFRFAAGTVAANLQEVGVGWGTSGSTLITRAALLDPVTQLPTPITPLAAEILDVDYELRYYPPTVDVTSPSVTLNGVVYDTITRAAYVTNDKWSASIGEAIAADPLNTDWAAYDGNISSDLTSGPSGSNASCDNSSQNSSYNGANTYTITLNCSCGAGGWNLGSGIRSIRWATTAGWYQTQFSSNPGGSTIPKDTNYTMNMQWSLSWAEKV